MPETCLACGRTYPDAYAYDYHSCIDPADIARAAATHECHEEVTRRGTTEPCDLPAVGVRIDPNENAPYPVCKRHVRGAMVPLPSIAESAWTASAPTRRKQGRNTTMLTNVDPQHAKVRIGAIDAQIKELREQIKRSSQSGSDTRTDPCRGSRHEPQEWE